MEQNSFDRLLRFMAKSGDRCVIMEKGQPAFVLMKIEDYEDLLMSHSGVDGLTEEELLDKINGEIALWRANQEDDAAEEIMTENSPQYEPRESETVEESPTPETDRYYVEPV